MPAAHEVTFIHHMSPALTVSINVTHSDPSRLLVWYSHGTQRYCREPSCASNPFTKRAFTQRGCGAGRNVILGATGTGCNRSETSARTQSHDPINRNVLTFAVQGCMLTGSNQAITTVVPCYDRLDSSCVVVVVSIVSRTHRTSCTSYP